MLNTEKLDRLQKRLEFWDRPGNPITVNDGLELVALARKGLEAERLEREADWLAQAAANNGWHGVRVSPAFMREQAKKAVEAEK